MLYHSPRYDIIRPKFELIFDSKNRSTNLLLVILTFDSLYEVVRKSLNSSEILPA